MFIINLSCLRFILIPVFTHITNRNHYNKAFYDRALYWPNRFYMRFLWIQYLVHSVHFSMYTILQLIARIVKCVNQVNVFLWFLYPWLLIIHNTHYSNSGTFCIFRNPRWPPTMQNGRCGIKLNRPFLFLPNINTFNTTKTSN